MRVDVLYAGFDTRQQGRVNAVGSILLGMTTCWVIILVGMGSANAIINSPVKNFEVSQTGTAGMYTKYQMAAFLAVFAITMLIQFVSYLFEAVADARGRAGPQRAPTRRALRDRLKMETVLSCTSDLHNGCSAGFGIPCGIRPPPAQRSYQSQRLRRLGIYLQATWTPSSIQAARLNG